MNLVEALKLTKSKAIVPNSLNLNQNDAIEEAANVIFKIVKNEMKNDKDESRDKETKNDKDNESCWDTEMTYDDEDGEYGETERYDDDDDDQMGKMNEIKPLTIEIEDKETQTEDESENDEKLNSLKDHPNEGSSIKDLNHKIKQVEKALKDIDNALKKSLKTENKNMKKYKLLLVLKKILTTVKYPIIGAFSGAGAYFVLNQYLEPLFNNTDSQVVLTTLMFQIMHTAANLFN